MHRVAAASALVPRNSSILMAAARKSGSQQKSPAIAANQGFQERL
jgi:hypothetical protein